MPRTGWTDLLTDDELAQVREPRADLLIERPDGPDRWVQAEGPFKRYERRLEITGQANGHLVTETTSYATAIPLWGLVYDLVPFRRALRDRNRTPRRRWWWPEQIINAQSATLVGLLGCLSVIAGYLGVMISQTLTFAAEDFGATDSDQGDFLAGLRVGALAGLAVIWFGDRFGRRPVLLACVTGSLAFTVLGAFSPGLEALWVTQTVAKGLDAALLTMIGLAATEEVPASVRALAISLQAMASALGAGMVLWVLPLADIGPGWWRAPYAAAALFTPLVWYIWRNLPETRRYQAADVVHAPSRISMSRFAMVAASAFLASIFLSPASQLQNEFLRDERGFSAGNISLFRLVVSTPAGLAILGAGLAADRYGRKVIGTVSLAAGAVATAMVYQSSGAWLWLWAVLGVWLFAATYPALRGYQTELFPTRARSRVGGWIDVIAVAGSATGLVVAGRWSDRVGTLAVPMMWLSLAALAAAVVVAVFFPETARRELEEFNPSDPSPAQQGAPTERVAER